MATRREIKMNCDRRGALVYLILGLGRDWERARVDNCIYN